MNCIRIESITLPASTLTSTNVGGVVVIVVDRVFSSPPFTGTGRSEVMLLRREAPHAPVETACDALQEVVGTLLRVRDRRREREALREWEILAEEIREVARAVYAIPANHTLAATMQACKRRSSPSPKPVTMSPAVRSGVACVARRGGTRGSRRSRVHRGFWKAMGRKRR